MESLTITDAWLRIFGIFFIVPEMRERLYWYLHMISTATHRRWSLHPVGLRFGYILQAANIDAHERIRLFRLACDAALTSFSGRQQLYERYFAGDPVRSQASYANSFDKEPSIARITGLLDKWEAELR